MIFTPARAAIAILAVAASTIGCSRPSRLAADLVITHGNIWTGDAARPAARALAIIGDRIVDVGGEDEIEHWRGPGTTVLDAAGRRVLPGFNDAHVQFADGGVRLDTIDLRDAGSQAEFVRRIAERVKAKPGEWILGGDWDDRRWTPAALPTRQLIDEATNGTPVFVSRYDGHMALANSAAFGRAGVTEQTSDPPGGALVRDPVTGFPTGLLKDEAMAMVTRVIPKMTPDERLRAVKRALEYAASLGVTSVQDMNPQPEDLAAYADLASRGELTARIYAAPIEAGWYDQAKLGVRRAFGSPWLRIGAVAGSAGGLLAPDVNQLRIRLMAADHAGLQLCIRAADDAGFTRVLDLFDEIVRANGGRDRRLRVEEAQRMAPGDVARASALDVVASVQPQDMSAGGSFRPLIDKGVRLALGSGWSSAPLNPLLTLEAVTAHGVTVVEAVTAYTSGSAFAEFQDTEKGALARGKLADLVILSDDVFSISSAQIRNVRVLTTIVGGRIVRQRNP